MKTILIIALVISALYLIKELWYAWGLSEVSPTLKSLAEAMGRPYREPQTFWPFVLTIAFSVALYVEA